MGQTPGVANPLGRLSLIVNPRAGGSRSRAALQTVVRALEAQGLDHDVWLTEGPGHAGAIARRRLKEGGRFLVAVGGDGTVHEVANGMLEGAGPEGHRPVLGVVAAGSGCDYIRTFGLPAEPGAAAARLAGSGVVPVDVARVGYVDRDGRPASRHFVNIAEAGLGGSTAGRAVRLPRFLGQSRYLAAFWAVLPSYRAGGARIEVDGEVAYEGRAVNVVIANCRYFGGGMHISPRSEPGDGTLELLVFNGRKTDSFTMLPRIYRGRHLPHRNIVELRGRRFVVATDQPLEAEADGEVLGTSPLTVELVPAALSLKV